MKKREIVLSIIIVAMFVLVMFCIVKASNLGRRLSELEVEQRRPCNVSVSVTCVPTLPLKARANNLTNADIGQDHLQANNQLGSSTDTQGVTTPEICASQWLQDEIAVAETLACIEEYARDEQLRIRRQEP